MAKRILNRKELRADFDAAERRKQDGDEVEEVEEESDDEEGEEQGQAEEEAGDEDEEEEAPKKKKPAKTTKAKPRSRASKIVRMKIVWGVFDNSNRCIATYEYPKRKDAEEHAAKLTADKRNTHFVQPVKEPIEQK